MNEAITLLLFFLLLFSSSRAVSKPLLGIVGPESGNPLTRGKAALVQKHLRGVAETTGVFSLLDPAQLTRELNRYNCADEGCMLRFAREAGIDILVGGTISERGNATVLELYCYGVQAPYFGRVIHRYSAEIPSGISQASGDSDLILEEQAAIFLAGLLRTYKTALALRFHESGIVTVDPEAGISGTYEVFRYRGGRGTGAVRHFREIGKVTLIEGRGRFSGDSGAATDEGDFILHGYEEKAALLDDFTHGRKKEMVFGNPSLRDTFFAVLFSVPASVTMPVVAPVVYYSYGDFQGLSLWALNFAPYLYLEYDGLTNRPEDYQEKKKDIPKEVSARYLFGVYMLLVGGLPLFVDAFSHEYLREASLYTQGRTLMGNDATAAYLSLVSGGGGMFYRGYRSWGYLYFHANNILLYTALTSLLPTQTYDDAEDTYRKEPVNRKAGYLSLGLLVACKLVEVVHVLSVRDRIYSGRPVERRISLEPVFYMHERDKTVAGMRVSFSF